MVRIGIEALSKFNLKLSLTASTSVCFKGGTLQNYYNFCCNIFFVIIDSGEYFVEVKFKRERKNKAIFCWLWIGCEPLPSFFKNGQTLASFSFIFGLFQTTIQFLKQINTKKCPSIYSAEIRTHNLWNMSRPP